jgi:hypothetical protein
MPPVFRFSIRELVLVTIIVAMGAAWYVEHRQQVSLRLNQARIHGQLLRSHQTEALRARESESKALSRLRSIAEP